MKKLFMNKTILLLVTIIVVSLSILFGLNVKADSYDDSGLVVKGDHTVVDIDDISNEHNINFTFKTTDTNYQGFICGTYVLQYDPDRLDIDVNSIRQKGGMSPVNADYTVFTINGAPAQKGMILIGFASTLPSQDYDLNFKVKNLFKNGDYTPIEIGILNRSEDPLRVMDILDQPYVPKTPIIKKATISLASMSVDIQGPQEVQTGQEFIYKATVKNALSNNKVTWSISGAKSSQTKIDQNGKLFIADDETSKTIQVMATSEEDSTISASKNIQVQLVKIPTIDIKGSQNVIKGTKNNIYQADIQNMTDTSLIWSLRGQTSSKTVINNQGQLTVAVDEQASSLDIVATSQLDPSILTKYNIKLIDKTYTITNVELTNKQINMNSTQTKAQLNREIDKNTYAKVNVLTNDKQTYIIDAPISNHEINDVDLIKNNLLNPGKYDIKYTLDLPFLLIDENGIVTLKDQKTNIKGQSTILIPLNVIRKNVETPSNASKEKQEANTAKVKTSDSTDVTNSLVALTSSFIIFVIFKSNRSRRKKNEIK